MLKITSLIEAREEFSTQEQCEKHLAVMLPLYSSWSQRGHGEAVVA